jgi:ribosome-associated protein
VPLTVNAALAIPDGELELAFVRSSGPGGQNVNKVASAVQLRFDLSSSSVLSEAVKARLRNLSGRRLTADGALLIVARTHRSQEQNRREAEQRLVDLVQRALIAPKARKATAPPRAARERRLERKTRVKRTKHLRGRPGWDD